MMRKIALVFLSILVASSMTMMSTPVAAESEGEFFEDPVGDTFTMHVSAFIQPYLDETGLFWFCNQDEMTMTWTFMLAGPIGEDSVMHPSVWMVWWQILFDTDVDSYVSGWPGSPNMTGSCEFMAQVTWDGAGAPGGMLIDKRPSVEGMDPIVTEITVGWTDDPASVSLTVSLDDLDNPESFRWTDQLLIWHGPYGSAGFFATDWNDGISLFYPDYWVPWP